MEKVVFNTGGVPILILFCIWNVLLVSTISLYLAKYSDTLIKFIHLHGIYSVS